MGPGHPSNQPIPITWWPRIWHSLRLSALQHLKPLFFSSRGARQWNRRNPARFQGFCNFTWKMAKRKYILISADANKSGTSSSSFYTKCCFGSKFQAQHCKGQPVALQSVSRWETREPHWSWNPQASSKVTGGNHVVDNNAGNENMQIKHIKTFLTENSPSLVVKIEREFCPAVPKFFQVCLPTAPSSSWPHLTSHSQSWANYSFSSTLFLFTTWSSLFVTCHTSVPECKL